MVFKVVVCGTREFRTKEENQKVREAVRERIAELDQTFEGEELLVIGGGARGPDTWAVQAADELMIHTHVEEAVWRQGSFYNPRAGFERNIRMLDMRPDLVIAFWDGYSGGTKHTIDEAEKRGIEVEVYTFGAHKI